ncbi:MAG TPA: PKD domain-containing protein [Verrucomicrobiae bacterium]|nr:PKD domain-containing protein [Verrucomicrobiae bacterium]
MSYLRYFCALPFLFFTLNLFAIQPVIGRLDASTAPGKLNLHWTSAVGQWQQIQVSSDLVHWSNLPPVLVSVLTNSTWADDGTLTGGVLNSPQGRYYRLAIQPQALGRYVGAQTTFLPAATGVSYSWDFGDGTTSTASNPNHVYQADGIYTVIFSVTDANGIHSGTNTVWAESTNQILLTPAVLAGLRQKAASNTAQWQSFKQQLDGQLNEVIGPGAYEGDELTVIGDYALGYKVLEFQDPVTAAKYADKAIGVMKSAAQDFQKVGEVAQIFLARGDGVTKVFTLPHTNIVASSLDVYTAPIQVLPVTRSTKTNKTDSVDFYLTFIKVSNTSDGTADYQQGVDWQHSGDLGNDQIDWSIAAPGRLPAAGATYYVTAASSLDIANASASLSGNKITFTTAPATNKAIYVQYVYGVHATNFSTLAFQQTSAGDGGFNSMTIDDGYTSRYLGKFTSMGYDWLYGYPGMTPAFKSQVASLLVRWSDYWKVNGYRADDPASNYSEGGYASRMLTALALSGGRDTNAPRLINEVVAFRQANVLPVITNTSTSDYGGFWAEGWNYGAQAARNLILSGLALETAGLGNAAPERQWAGQVINGLISQQPSQTQLYDGGDWYDYPAPFVDKDLLYMCGAATTDNVARSNANYIIQNYTGRQLNDMQDLIYRDPSAAAAFWGSAPLAYYAQGTGLITARADWSYTSTWLAFQLGNELETDHQAYNQGQLEVQRGGNGLLINANEVGGNQTPSTESSFGNLVAIDDNGAGTQNYSFNQGSWFGTPGCRITSFEATNGYVYVAGDYAAAYSLNTTPGTGTATKLTRQIVYLRPDFIMVHDRATTKAVNDPKQLRWHFLKPPTVSAGANSWVATNGTGKLFGQTFSRSALMTTNMAVKCPAGSSTVVYRVVTQNSNTAAGVTYVTALQSAPSTAASMVRTTSILSTDGRMEGVQMSTNVVMFGADAALNPFTGSISYTVTGSAPVVQVLTDLPPNRAFQVSAGGSSIATITSSAQGVLSFTNTPAGATVITIQ